MPMPTPMPTPIMATIFFHTPPKPFGVGVGEQRAKTSCNLVFHGGTGHVVAPGGVGCVEIHFHTGTLAFTIRLGFERRVHGVEPRVASEQPCGIRCATVPLSLEKYYKI